MLCPGWMWHGLCHSQNSSTRGCFGRVASAWAHGRGCREIFAAPAPALNASPSHGQCFHPAHRFAAAPPHSGFPVLSSLHRKVPCPPSLLWREVWEVHGWRRTPEPPLWGEAQQGGWLGSGMGHCCAGQCQCFARCQTPQERKWRGICSMNEDFGSTRIKWGAGPHVHVPCGHSSAGQCSAVQVLSWICEQLVQSWTPPKHLLQPPRKPWGPVLRCLLTMA